jgi:hypothetical protein
MKKTVLLAFLLFGLLSGYSQTITMKTSSVSVCEKTAKGSWSNWTDFKNAELVITIDARKNRIIINSPEIQVFTITSYGERIETENDKIVPFDCMDNNGSKCKILAIIRKKEGNRMQFYVNYSEVKFVYNIYN